MRILIAAVGRAKAGPERDLFEHFRARIRAPFSLDLKEVEEKRSLSTPEMMRREADLLLGAVPKGAVAVALDERGAQLSSIDFAGKLGGWRDQGMADVVLLIGGADGLDKTVLRRARMVLSLGSATWPHMLVRGLLAEQIFRAQCILGGHPYHRK